MHSTHSQVLIERPLIICINRATASTWITWRDLDHMTDWFPATISTTRTDTRAAILLAPRNCGDHDPRLQQLPRPRTLTSCLHSRGFSWSRTQTSVRYRAMLLPRYLARTRPAEWEGAASDRDCRRPV